MSKISLWHRLGFDRIDSLRKVLRHNKGLGGLMYNIFRMDAIKHGDLVGTDKYGNKYYQNNFYFVGRNRWVEYNQTVFLDYDGSQVPPEWHNWLHYVCDDPPTENPRVHHKWMIDHTENLSGSNKTYVPYSTVPPKIKSWQPAGTQLKLTSAKRTGSP